MAVRPSAGVRDDTAAAAAREGRRRGPVLHPGGGARERETCKTICGLSASIDTEEDAVVRENQIRQELPLVEVTVKEQ